MTGGAERGSVEVRDIAPGDVPAVAALHRRMFPDYFLSHMGQRFLECFYREFVLWAENCATVADLEGQVVGFVAGSADSANLYRRLYRRRFLTIGGLVVARFFADGYVRRHVFRRLPHVGLAIRSLFTRRSRRPPGTPDPDSGEPLACLLSIAVSPEHRGRGIAEQMVDQFCGQLRGCGAREVLLSARPENKRAIAFYKKSGWTLSEVKPNGVYFTRSLER